MKALIFAAGRGERLKPLTDHTPKPLVKIKGKPLLQYHLEALYIAGVRDIVINVSWLKEQVMSFVSDFLNAFNKSDLNIQFSVENQYPLETGGGMLRALPLLGPDPFIVVNADIYTDFDFQQLPTLSKHQLVHLVLVPNPSQNQNGDFSLEDNELILKSAQKPSFTYAGIGVYSPDILQPPFIEEVFSVVPYIYDSISSQTAMGQIHMGKWHDVGTLDRLNELNDDRITQPDS